MNTRCKYLLFLYIPGIIVLAGNVRNNSLVYILQWTSSENAPFNKMGKGHEIFVASKCYYTNCFITSDKWYFNDIRSFDAIAFHGPEIVRHSISTPSKRDVTQKYIFVSLESSHYYPLCKQKFQNFFNWTWTYKLDSELLYLYMAIRDKSGDIIGPREIMHWMKFDDMTPINDSIISRLQTKHKTAAWIVSNCDTPGGREAFVVDLKFKLQKYWLTIDIYGECGIKDCKKEFMFGCWNMIERDYYFYLSFENSFSEDYVTEKLLNPLQHYTVPIVYGEANYTRFMPDGAYLDARKLGAEQLAKEMYNIINNKEMYYSFFKWRNHYSYHDPDLAPDSSNFCRLCELLNDERAKKVTVMYSDFSSWWNPPGHSC